MADIIDSLNNQIQNLQHQISQVTGEISANNGKIRRLKEAKKSLENHKDDAESNRDSFNGLLGGFDADENWSGNRKDDVRSVMADDVKNDYQSYVDRVDEALDAVCDEITNLENANMSKFGAITWMERQVNSLVNEVRKQLN